MRCFTRIFLLFTALVLAGYYLPSLYSLLTAKRMNAPMVYLADESQEFLFMRVERKAGETRVRYEGEEGRSYESDEFEQMLPLMFASQLLKNGTMPKSVRGVEIVPSQLRRESFFVRLRPAMMDSPQIALYPVFEVDNGRAKLETPEDFMRLTKDGVEFVVSTTNTLDVEKGAAFTERMKAAGFVFPARLAASNPTVRKPYDEGVLLVDAQNEVFRLRMAKGQAEVLKVSSVAEDAEAWKNLNPRYLQVNETDMRELHATIVSEAGDIYMAVGEKWRLVKLPLTTYDPAKTNISIRANLLHRLIVAESPGVLEVVAMDRDYQFLKRHTEPLAMRENTCAGKIAKIIFPFTWDMEARSSGFFGFYFKLGSPWVLALNVVLLVLTLLFLKIRRRKLSLLDALAILIGGLYGLLAIFLLPRSSNPALFSSQTTKPKNA